MWLGPWLSALLSKVTAEMPTEMPTSGDLKSGDCLFFSTPLPRNFNTPPPPKIDPGPNGNDLEHYMTSYMMLHD